MKLSKRDRAALESALAELKRGQKFLLEDNTLVCRRSSFASTTLHFTNQKGEICQSIDKRIGSELTILHNGIRSIERLLEASDKKSGGKSLYTLGAGAEVYG